MRHSRFTTKQISEIFKRREAGEQIQTIADRFGVHKSAIKYYLYKEKRTASIAKYYKKNRAYLIQKMKEYGKTYRRKNDLRKT